MAPARDEGSNDAIFKTLAHHDSRLTELNTRMTGVETALVSLDKKFDYNSRETSSALRDIEKAIQSTQAKQGPGLTQIMYACSAAAVVLGVVTSGISMLVSSQFSPAVSTLQANVAQLQGAQSETSKAMVTRLEINDMLANRNLIFVTREQMAKETVPREVLVDLRDRVQRLENNTWAPTVVTAARTR